MFVNSDNNPVASSISLVKALLKLVGFAPAAAMIDGGQELYQLLTDISNGSLGDPNAEMIRSLNSVMNVKINQIEADLKNDGVDRTRVKQTLTTLLDATKSTIKNLAADESRLLEAIRNPDSFPDLVKREAVALPEDSDENIQFFYRQLLEVVAEEFLTLAPCSPRFNRVALADLIRCFPDWRNRIDRLEQSMNNRFDKVDEDNQEIIGLLREQSSSVGRLFFGSRPDVVAAERFVERDEHKQLKTLITDLTRQRTVLSGMRGCGKTQLAASLAKQCEDANWDLVAWINAVSRESIQSDLVELAKQLGIGTSDQPTQDQVIRSFLSRVKSAEPADRLVVFDNVEDIDHLTGLIPSGDGVRVVATTTNKVGWEDQGWNSIKVGVFDRSESINSLLTVTKSDDYDTADVLAKRLGDLPLAIAQAAATARHKNLSLSQYLNQLDTYRSERAIRPGPGDYYTEDVATALWMAVEDALENLADPTRRSARRQLGALALLAESGVPTRWLDPTIEQQDNQGLQGANQAADEDAHDALTELIHRSIVQQSADRATTMLHRLQAQVLRESWTEKERRDANESSTALLSRVTTNMACENNTDARQRDTLDLIEQLRAVSVQKYSQCLLAESATQNCLFQAFEQAFELGVPQHAVNLSAAVSLFNSIENIEPSDALVLKNQLGCAYEAAGDYDTAIRLHSEVLAAYEQMIDIDAEEILISRNNLATAYKANRNIPKAIEILEGTFKEAYQRYGLEHEQTIGSLNNLAETYTQVYEPDIILPMFIVAFELSKEILNPADDISLAIRNNLALTYLKMGDATKAICEFTSLLQDRQRFHLDRHVKHLITLRNLADAHEANGDMKEAISTLKRARAEGTELHGDHDLETLWTVNSLGCAYLQDNKFESARHEFESALAKCDKFLDYNHPLTTTIRTNLEYVEQLLATTSESGPTTRRHMD